MGPGFKLARLVSVRHTLAMWISRDVFAQQSRFERLEYYYMGHEKLCSVVFLYSYKVTTYWVLV